MRADLAASIKQAEDESGNHFAVKLLDSTKATKEKVRRFKNELLFCQRNQHQNIVTVIDHGILKDAERTSPFYVMPLCTGSLRGLIRSGISTSKVLPYFAKLLDGVEAAHLQGVIHRDLKPENVLYDRESDTLLVADFGIARFQEDELYTAVETKESTQLANFQYAAPEQRGRGLAVDHRADIYALGLMLNEMFTGEVPYGTGYKTIGSVAPEHEYLDELVSEMLRQAPDERPSAIEVIKQQLIGRYNDFITRQRISELGRVVVPVTELDDPLIVDPPRLINCDWDPGSRLLRWTPSIGQHWGNVISEGPAVFPRYTNALLAGHLLSFDCSSDCTESPLNTSAGVR